MPRRAWMAMAALLSLGGTTTDAALASFAAAP
jgi:hypothetical protein